MGSLMSPPLARYTAVLFTAMRRDVRELIRHEVDREQIPPESNYLATLRRKGPRGSGQNAKKGKTAPTPRNVSKRSKRHLKRPAASPRK